jgi:2'-5' RNA ligase
MPRPNWFFSFPLDGSFVLQLPELPPAFRRYHPDDVHMTLAFLGGCGEAAALRALGVIL